MFKFTFDEKEYILDDENFDELINDDEKPVKNIDKDTILQLLNEYEDGNITRSECINKIKNLGRIYRDFYCYAKN